MKLGATLELATAADTVWDIVIVGAGPAGSSAAIHLARLGASVLLVDRAQFPRTKVCGCCLNSRSLAALSAMGLGTLSALGAVRQSSINLTCGRRSATLPLPNTQSLSRETLDAALIRRAIETGAHFMPATRASLHEIRADFAIVELKQNENPQQSFMIRAKIALAADGLAGRFASAALGGLDESPVSRIGIGAIIERSDVAQALDQSIMMVCAPGGYVGLAEVEEQHVALAAALDPAYILESGLPAAAIQGIFQYSKLEPPARLEAVSLRGTPALTRRPRNVAAQRLFALGDAAGYVEPFTGEGMPWAFAAGEAVAPIAQRATQGWSPGFALEWQRRYRDLVAQRQWLCRAMAYTLRRPALTQTAIAIAAAAPALARPIVASLNRAESTPTLESSIS